MSAGAVAAQANVLDPGRLTALKRQVRAGDAAASREVAQQFEALFTQMMIKSMRDAVPRQGLFDSSASRLYESLHDQQLALQLGRGRGLGLAAMVERQLGQAPARIEDLGPMTLRREAVPIPLDPANPTLRRGQAPTRQFLARPLQE